MTTYTTWSTTDKSSNVTLSNGNLTATWTASANTGVRSASGVLTGKYYFELTTGAMANTGEGVATAATAFSSAIPAGSATIVYAGTIYINGTSSGVSLGTVSGSTTIGIALDLTNQMIWFRKAPSGNWNNNASYNPATSTGGLSISSITSSGTLALFPVSISTSGTSNTLANFGATGFSGAVPSGFTSGLPAAVVNVLTTPISASAGAVASVRAAAAFRPVLSTSAFAPTKALAAFRAILSASAVSTTNATSAFRAALSASAASVFAARFLPISLASTGALLSTRAMTKARSATATGATQLARVVVMKARSVATAGALRLMWAVPKACSIGTSGTLRWVRATSGTRSIGIAGTLSATRSATRGLLAATTGALVMSRGALKSRSIATLGALAVTRSSLRSLALAASDTFSVWRAIGKHPAVATSGRLSAGKLLAKALLAWTRNVTAGALHAGHVRLIAISAGSAVSRLTAATRPLAAQIATGSVTVLGTLSTIGRVSLELAGRGGALVLSALGRRNR